MTQVIHSPYKMKDLRKTWAGKSVGFVPTMGALHEGHETLLKKARAENDIVVLSIFVNPTQFNDPKDLEKYPSTWESDLEMAIHNKVDFLFAPTFTDMYPDQYRYKLIENSYSQILCGKDRPGHFDGVLSVVLKLFQIVGPQKAYFGEKDYQQLTLIQGMVQALFLDVQIVPVPTVRESDGLAMSSRNKRLTPQQREVAPFIYKTISTSSSSQVAIEKLTQAGFAVDYVLDIQDRRFVAAKLGEIRLIDNVKI